MTSRIILPIFCLLCTHMLATPPVVDTTKPFELTLTTFNHAERIYNGTTTYIVTNSAIKVVNYGMFETKARTTFRKRLKPDRPSIVDMSNTKIDSLKDLYFNFCVLPTSGSEYTITFKAHASTKTISLHHYYLKPIDQLIELINDNLPKKQRINYLSKDTQQDCALMKNGG